VAVGTHYFWARARPIRSSVRTDSFDLSQLHARAPAFASFSNGRRVRTGRSMQHTLLGKPSERSNPENDDYRRGTSIRDIFLTHILKTVSISLRKALFDPMDLTDTPRADADRR